MAHSRIIVVDGDDDDRYLTCQILEGEGYRVEATTSGERAFEGIKSAQPDLVITNTFTRDIGGVALVHRIRAVFEVSALPVVMYSPITNQAKIAALKAGVNDFLTRPFHQIELIARTRALLATAQAHREIVSLKQILDTKPAEFVNSAGLPFHYRSIAVSESQRAQREWAAIFNGIKDAVLITDAAGKIIRANSAAGLLFSQAPGQLYGKRCSNLLEENTVCPHYSLSELITSAEIECRSRRPELRLMIRTCRIAEGNGDPISFAHVLRACSAGSRAISLSGARPVPIFTALVKPTAARAKKEASVMKG